MPASVTDSEKVKKFTNLWAMFGNIYDSLNDGEVLPRCDLKRAVPKEKEECDNEF